jgi:hypothetical protein
LKKLFLSILAIIILTACSDSSSAGVLGSFTSTPAQSSAVVVPPTYLPQEDTPSPSSAPTPSQPPEPWKSLPVIPAQVSSRIIGVFQRGLSRGRDPNRFSKIGDCQNITPYFLSVFDDPSKYRLGDQYTDLQLTVDRFQGSWSRPSVATHGGYNAATVMSPFWTIVPRPELCDKGETPVACEIRVNNPSFAIISMEEAWSGDLQKYDYYMRLLVEYVLSQDVVPIIATRAELPGSQTSINQTVAQIAYDYSIPLWNFGVATIALPDFGLSADGFHLTPGTVEGNYYFDDPARMQLGWTWRNLTALQILDAVSRILNANQ